jgi:hypothetical protein
MAVSFIDAGNYRIILFVKGHWQKTIELSHDVVHLAIMWQSISLALMVERHRFHKIRFNAMIFNPTFNYISVISWQSVFFVEETRVPRENHQPATSTNTCFIQKIYAPSSSLLQGKYLPFSPSPLCLNIFRLFVILSLTQLYRYTPEIFLFSTATFKYTYRAPPQMNWTRIFSERGLVKISVIETDTATSGPI